MGWSAHGQTILHHSTGRVRTRLDSARGAPAESHLCGLGRSSALEEPADEGDPNATNEVASQHLPNPDADEQEPKSAPDRRSDQRRALQVVDDHPDNGAESLRRVLCDAALRRAASRLR
jgi:hypothetical protein